MNLANANISNGLLTTVLEALQERKARIEQQISDVRAAMGETAATGRRGRPRKVTATTGNTAVTPAATHKRILSPEARERIRKAQRERWAAVRKAQTKTGKTGKTAKAGK